MAEATNQSEDGEETAADGSRINPVTAAALFGGTMAVAAGAYFGTRALARKNRQQDGRPLNSVLATAITACDLAHPKAGAERVTSEPKVRIPDRS